MNCVDAGRLVDAYVDGELDLVHSIEVEKHLDECRKCAGTVENHRALRAAMQAGALYYPAPGAERLLPQRKRPRWVYSMIPVAASLLIAAFFLGRLQPRGDLVAQSVLDSHLRSLIPGHLADVESTDQHTVKPWFNGKIDFSPPVTDFAQQGFPLVGGRMDSVNGHPAAALIYRRSKHVINVFVWPSDGSSRRAKSVERGYNAIHWKRSGFEWWAISDLNANELGDFAALLGAAGP